MNSKTINAVIFDLDGTLLNTLEDIADSANETIRHFGMEPHPLESYRYFVGNGLANLIKRIMPDEAGSAALDRGIEIFQNTYQQRWHEKTRPYPGIMEMLDSLQRTGIKIAVLSNKPDSLTQECVMHFFPAIRFHAVSGKKADVPLKPHPQSTLSMLQALETHPQQSLFVGDSSVDMHTGIAAGMRTIGVDWGFRTESELTGAGADLVISLPQELLHYVISA